MVSELGLAGNRAGPRTPAGMNPKAERASQVQEGRDKDANKGTNVPRCSRLGGVGLQVSLDERRVP